MIRSYFFKALETFYKLRFNFIGHKVVFIKKNGYDFRKNFFVVVGHGWNDLDAFLPILTWIKHNNANFCITTLFICSDVWMNIDKENTRFETLLGVSDNIILPNRFSIPKNVPKFVKVFHDIKLWAFDQSVWYKKNLRKIGIKICACIMGLDKVYIPFSICFKEMFPDSFLAKMSVISFFCESLDYCCTNESVKQFFPADFFLAADNFIFSKITDREVREKIILTGSPKIDRWWIKERQAVKEVRMLKDTLLMHDSKIVACIFPTLNDDSRYNENEKKLFCMFLNEHKDYKYIFKFHPRDSLETRNFFLKKYVSGGINWFESKLELIQLAAIADVMLIIGLTNSTGDVLSAGIPVVSFYDSYRQRAGWLYKLSENRYGDFFQLHDLLFHADNSEELSICLDEIFLHEGWKKYEGKFNEYLPDVENSCKMITDLLLNGYIPN